MKLPVFKKPTIKVDDWQKIESESTAATELLSNPRFQFLRDYLKNTQLSITDLFTQNRLKGITETILTRDNQGLVVSKKTFHTTRKEQEYELSGQYKLIEKLFADLQALADQAKEYRQQEEKGRIVIESSKEG